MTDKTFHLTIDEINHETESAFLVVVDGDEHWLPKSQIKSHDDHSMEITEWIAEQKGFI